MPDREERTGSYMCETLFFDCQAWGERLPGSPYTTPHIYIYIWGYV